MAKHPKKHESADDAERISPDATGVAPDVGLLGPDEIRALFAAKGELEETKARPGALEVLQRFGINHCCGAHLSLREAAAAAGVRVENVLEALAGARDRT